MKVLIIGSGGREYAIGWKIKKDNENVKLFFAPGNGGTYFLGENVNIKVDDLKSLVKFCKENDIELTVVGPELPLTLGIVDEFKKNKLLVFGPSKKAAQLEASKIFTKKFLKKYNIPTADFKIFSSYPKAKEYLAQEKYPLVIKADGLCAGKGVLVAQNKIKAENFLHKVMVEKIFGTAGEKVVIEECLIGNEFSFLVITDGKKLLPLELARDYKRIHNNDKGANTGGMGGYSPATYINEKTKNYILKNILKKTIAALKNEGIIYTGVLYGGLILTNNEIKVLEYNCRFGDPETQIILPRLKSNLLEIFYQTAKENLKIKSLNWDSEVSVCTVLAAKGYPENYKKGEEIKGLTTSINYNDKVHIFHAGTVYKNHKFFTNGGRVLNVVALSNNFKSAKKLCTAEIKKIKFKSKYYRKDIADKIIIN